MLRDSPQATAEGAFVQLIEFRTDRIEEFDAAAEEWLAAIGAERTAAWYIVGRDREDPGAYVEMVEFPSYDEAMVNSKHPATARIAERMREIVDGEPKFRNLDVVRARTP
jgi:quinol monooxygenase YgiN